MTATYKKYIRVLWLTIIGATVLFYLLKPEYFTKESIANFLQSNRSSMLVWYTILHVLRGFVLLPSTALIFAGLLLFPNEPNLVFGLSLFGILLSSSIVYFLSDKLDFASMFSGKQAVFDKLKTKLNGKYGALFIALWSFFPAVPTDLICYASGAMKVNYFKFIVALMLGEAILVAIYVYGADYFLGLLGW